MSDAVSPERQGEAHSLPASPAALGAPSRPARRAPERPAPVPSPSPARGTRWTDTITALLLFAAVGGVVIAATPALLRAAGVGGRAPDEPELRNGGRLSLPQAPVGAPANPIFSHGEDEEDDGSALRRQGTPRRPAPAFREPSSPRPTEPGPAQPDTLSGGKRAAPGIARRPLALLDQPVPGSAVIGEVRAGELVMIGKQAGEWLLVAHEGDDGVVMGWTKKSEILIR